MVEDIRKPLQVGQCHMIQSKGIVVLIKLLNCSISCDTSAIRSAVLVDSHNLNPCALLYELDAWPICPNFTPP